MWELWADSAQIFSVIIFVYLKNVTDTSQKLKFEI